MIDFEGELKKILNEDPLGILKNRTVQPITTDQRLKDSFEEINKFIDDKWKGANRKYRYHREKII